MRLGELLALQWEDIENDSVIVSNNLQTVNSYDNSEKKQKIVIGTTKRDKIRIIPLSNEAQRVLIIQEYNNNNNSDFIYFCAAGSPVQKRNIYRDMKAKLNILKDKYGENTDSLTFHSIRHSFATRLLEKGADIKTVSELLGHQSIQITLDIYSHVSQGLKKNTIDLLN